MKTIKHFFWLLSIPFVIFSASKNDIKNASEAIGKILRYQLEESQMNLSFDDIAKGMQQKVSAEEKNENEKIFLAYQEKVVQEFAQKNRKTAEQLFKTNRKNKKIKEIFDHKVQYEVLNDGDKNETVKAEDRPLITINGYYPDGHIFYASDEPEPLDFSTATPALKQAIIGMKKNEKRKVYLHPDLGYQTQSILHKDSVAIFEIEIIATNHSPAPQVSDQIVSPQ